MKRKPILLKVGERYRFQFQGSPNDLALFTIMGNALAAIQSFEFGIVHHLNHLDENSEGNSEYFFTQTLGRLILQFKKHLPDSGIDVLLERVRDRRNYLIHHILRKYQWPMMSDEDYVHGIMEVDEIRNLIEDANIEVANYLSSNSIIEMVGFSLDNDTDEITRLF